MKQNITKSIVGIRKKTADACHSILTTLRSYKLVALGLFALVAALNVADAGPSCTYSISPTSASATSGAATGSVSVTAGNGNGCTWTATSGATWITIVAGGSGKGNGAVTYSVTANTSTSPRTGTLTIAGKIFTLTQAGSTVCAYSISPTSASPSSSASSGTVSVTAGSACTWSATSTVNWITISAGNSGTGNGTVSYSVLANTSTTSRTGSLTIAGQSFTITQAGASSGNGTAFVAGKTLGTLRNDYAGWVGMKLTVGAAPISVTTLGRIFVTGNGGTHTLKLVNASTGTDVVGGSVSLSMAGGTSGQFEYVTLASPVALAPNTAYHLVSQETLGGDYWYNADTALSTTGDAACNSGVYSGNSSTWTLYGSPNNSFAPVDFKYTAGTPCTYAISPTSTSLASSGGSGTVSVTAGSTCPWTASSSVSWITITTVIGGPGNGTVSYSVAANTSTSSRSGTLTIAGQTFTVTQAAAVVDTTPPSVSLTAPSNGATVSGTITLSANASDTQTGVASVDFYCDGALLPGASDASAPYNASCDTTRLSNGSHLFQAKAYDGAGNWATSANTTAMVTNSTVPGAFQWGVNMGTSVSTDGASAELSAVDASGNVIVVGSFQGTVNIGGTQLISPGGSDVFIAKYSPNGSLLWAKKLGGVTVGYGVALDRSANIVVVGTCGGIVDFGGGAVASIASNDAFVAKYSSSGAYLWAKRFGPTNVSLAASAGCVAIDANDNVIFGGYSSGSVNLGGGLLSAGSYVAKYSASGAYSWSITSSWAGGMALDSAGNVMLSGSDIITMYAGTDGHSLWSKQFVGTGSALGLDVKVDVSGNILVTGNFTGTIDFGGGSLTTAYQAIFMAKYSAAGAHQWSKKFGGQPTGDSGSAIASDSNGNIFLTGVIAGAVDFGGGYLFGSTRDIFIAKFSASGGYQWAKRIGASYEDVGNSVVADANGNAIVCGYFGGSVNFGGPTPLTSGPCHQDGFVVKFGP